MNVTLAAVFLKKERALPDAIRRAHAGPAGGPGPVDGDVRDRLMIPVVHGDGHGGHPLVLRAGGRAIKISHMQRRVDGHQD